MHQERLVRTNDFALKIANVNGTGSASANGLLMQAIFRMGIPVSGKNLFPSNIQGLPTWYEVRVNKNGHTARALDYDLVVAMNAETYARDVKEVRSGGYLLFDSSWPLDEALARPDVTFLGVPLARMCNEIFKESRERILMKNIAYLGALMALLDIDTDIVNEMLEEKFSKKKALMDSNHRALKAGFEYARDHLDCPLPIRLERMAATDDRILIDGNTALALGCVYAGVTVAAWYPITPSTSVMDAFSGFCKQFRKDPETGKNNYCILQAEDELAAIGMVIGAGWNGARAFTSTSGPGISLMGELIGLAYYAEIPAVIVDIQRTGPSTGMPTRTQQGDLLACAYASHGDTKHILLFPSSPDECFTAAIQAFDLAERFQTPVFILSDLDIGMNDWVCPRLKWDDAYRPDRGRVLDAKQLEEIAKYFRYSPENDDQVAARTLPGVSSRGSFFTRGSGHNKLGHYTEIPDEYQEVMDRLLRKHRAAARAVPPAIIMTREPRAAEGAVGPAGERPQVGVGAGAADAPADARAGVSKLGIVSLGGCDPAVREGIELLADAGIDVDYLRVRAFPFGQEVEDFLSTHDRIFVVEQNRDAQLKSLLVLETKVSKDKLESILVYGGFPLSSRSVVQGVTRALAAMEAS